MTIPATPFEVEVAQWLAISTSQLRFTICLFACIPVAWLQRQIRHVAGAHLFAVVTGLLLIYYPFGNGVLHVVPPILITFTALHLVPRYCGTVVWLLCFPHLIYLHFVNASGAAWQDGAMDATGALMVLFLKLTAIAECRQDSENIAKTFKTATDYQKQNMIYKSPSVLEFLSYVFCFGHLLSGPFTEFKDYKNFIEGKGLWAEKLPPRGIPFLLSFLQCIACLMLFVFVGMHYSYTLYFTDEFASASLAEKYWMAIAIGSCYRWKYYFAWCVAEAASIASGFGYRGSNGEKNGERSVRWDRCKNVDIWETEFPSSFAKIPANWNICTGTFLRRYVYDRLTPAGQKPTFYTLLATQLVSGFWHGLYPGYFLFFVSASVAIASSKILHRWEQRSSVSKTQLYKICRLVYSVATLNYTASAFMILSFKESMQVYASMKFIPHIICAGICLVGPYVVKGQYAVNGKGKTE